jgi:hypothetical protein
MDNWQAASAVGAVATDRDCKASSRGGGAAPTGPGDRRRGGTHGEASPQQRLQPPGAPTSVKKGQPQHGIRRKLVAMGGNNHQPKKNWSELRRGAQGRDAAQHPEARTRNSGAHLASQHCKGPPD